jgi:hypothetical protein
LVASPLLLLLLSRLGMPAPATLVGGLATRAAALRRGAAWPFLLGACASLFLGVLSACHARAFDPFVILFVHLGGVVLLRGARSASDRRFVLDELGIWASVLCVAAVSGTRAWPLLLRDQGALPWGWNALARLPLSAACVLFVLSAARMHTLSADARKLPSYSMHVLRALIAPVCAGLFFGGAFIAPNASFELSMLGSVVAGAKSVACYALLCLLEGAALSTSRNLLWVVLFVVTPLWARLVPGRPFELIWGSVTCVMCCCIAVAGLVSMRKPLQSQPSAAARKPRAKAPARPVTAAPQAKTREPRSTSVRPPRNVPQTQT